TGQTMPLFHPRTQIWAEHFSWSQDGLRIVGLTPIGRATVAALHLDDDAKVQELAGKIHHFLDHRRDYDFAAIRQIVAEVAKLKLPDIKAIGEQIHFHPTGRSKAAMVSTLENWLSDVKLSAEQSSFTLTGVGRDGRNGS